MVAREAAMDTGFPPNVEACEPGRRLVLRARARPTGVARVEFELAGRDGGTEVIQSERPIEGPPARLHNPVQDWLIDRRNREGLRRLKQLVERR